MLKYLKSVKQILILLLIVSSTFACGQSQSVKKQDITQKSIQGTWFEIGEENASFEVNGKEVIYTENQGMPAKLQLKNDSLILDFGTEILIEKVEKLKNDTLILNSEGITTTYIRKK